jgi:Concanavalin A-like lectin/glucanases superfamily
MFGRFVAVVSGVALALTVTTGPALAGSAPTLRSIMGEFEPIQYWVLDDTHGPGANVEEGQLPIPAFGTGPAVTWHTAAHPVGGFEPQSVRLNASGKRSGQYLRSATRPGTETKPGTVVIWFRLPKTLPTWTQVLAVDNGAWSGTAAGLMISPTGHLVSEDASGFVDFHTKKPLTTGTWHCAVWTDTYHPDPDPAGSTLYLDGLAVSYSLVALWVPRLGVPGARLLLGDGGPHEAKAIGRFKGNLSNVAIYDSVLQPRDIVDIWLVGSTGGFGA